MSDAVSISIMEPFAFSSDAIEVRVKVDLRMALSYTAVYDKRHPNFLRNCITDTVVKMLNDEIDKIKENKNV